ncbi:MAG: PKD domain-containing protein, partial [Thermoplasmata archaeon]|nr:PKD domain-containing protein [Thermoplasmata archaeon]
DGSTWYADEGVFLSANSSYDPEGGNLTFRWYAKEINTGENRTLLTERYGWVSLSTGEYLITLNVTDSENLTSFSSVRITVHPHRNRPPLPHISSPRENSTYPKNTVIVFSSSGTWDENISSLRYFWFSNISGYLGSGEMIEASLPEGRHLITLYTDDGEFNTSTSVNITVYNRPPSVSIIAPSRVNVGESVHLSAEATDPDGDNLTFTWEMGDGTYLHGREVNHIYQSGGNYTVTLRVSDGSISNSTATAEHVIFVNQPPEVVTPQDLQAISGEPVNLTADATDPDGDPLTYQWDMDGDGRWDIAGKSITYTYTVPGEYTAYLNVSDPTAWRVVNFHVTVLPPNTPPVARAKSPVIVTLKSYSVQATLDASLSYDPDDDLNGDGRITPPEVDNLSYCWDLDPTSDSDGDGVPDNDCDLEGKVVTATFREAGKHTVLLNVTDPRGAWAVFKVTVIVNRPPVAEAEGPNRALVGQKLDFTAESSSDPDGDSITILWDFGDGARGSGVKVSHTYLSSGVFTITLTVSDGYVNSTFQMDVEVLSLPEIEITTPSPYAEVSGVIYITGNVPAPTGFKVEEVLISIDGAAFVDAVPEGGSYRTFSYRWDTTLVEDGLHTIKIKAVVSGIEIKKEIQVNVRNKEEGGGGFSSIYAVLIVVIVILLILILYLRGKARSIELTPLPESTPSATPPPPPSPAPQEKEEKGKLHLRVHCPRCGKYFDWEGEESYPIRLRCPYCGARGVIEKEGEGMEEKMGVPVVCPVCGEVFYITEPKPFMTCPSCKAKGRVPVDVLKELKEMREEKIMLRCPKCGEKFTVPRDHKGAVVCPNCGATGYI